MEPQLRVHSILHGGTVDGPGVRTVVFTQGCAYRCLYCHNRDTWGEGGKLLTVAKILTEVRKDIPFYGRRGGVTLSGGEPLLQADGAYSLFAALRKEGIHTCLDTAGSVLNESVIKLLSVTDLVLLDIKHSDPASYRALTGGNLDDVLRFLAHLQDHDIPYRVRHVLVEGFTDTEEEIAALIELMGAPEKLELIPYHGRGEEKWVKSDAQYPLHGMKDFDLAKYDRLCAYAEALLRKA